MASKRYIPRANQIDAVQWNGANGEELLEFSQNACIITDRCIYVEDAPMNLGHPGDYLVKFQDGRLAIVEEDKFNQQYEEMPENLTYVYSQDDADWVLYSQKG